MASEESTRAKMAQLRLSCELEIRACHERSGLLASSIRESIKSIKPSVGNILTNRGKLAKLKGQLKELEASFRGTLKVNASKEAKHTAISEAITAMVVRIEHLKKTVDDQKAKKDEYEAVLSQQLLALQKIEEKNEEVAIEMKKVKEATDWYKSILGFQTEGGEGVQFIFNKIDPNDQYKEYWFVVRLDGDVYTLLHCNPQLDDIEELVEELNRTNGLFKFVRVMREKFKETACKGLHQALSLGFSPISGGVLHKANILHSKLKDSHSIAVSSPPPNSIDSRAEMFSQDNSSSQSKKHQADSLHKVAPRKAAILSPQSISNFRHSPRLMVRKFP